MLEIVSPTEQRVRDLVEEFKLTFRRTLELAVQIGEALEQHKTTVTHGEWLPWVETHFELGERMARRFMELHRNRSDLTDLPPDTSVDAAVKWLQEQRREPRQLPEPGTVEGEPFELLRFCQDLDTATIVTLILEVAFSDATSALDVTYGSGNFWNGAARVGVTAHDLDPARAPHGAVDFTSLPYDDASFDVVLADPPHLSDASEGSIMAERFGTANDADLRRLICAGVCEAWRVARLGAVIKVTDHVHGQRFQRETGWVINALGIEPYEIVHQVRTGALVDPKWEQQLSARNNGSTFLIFRKGDSRHVRRAKAL